jgi:hypothetical protein
MSKLLTVTNEEPKFGADLSYHAALVRKDKAWVTLLITDSELKTILERGEKNPEDHLTPSWRQKFCAWIGI